MFKLSALELDLRHPALSLTVTWRRFEKTPGLTGCIIARRVNFFPVLRVRVTSAEPGNTGPVKDTPHGVDSAVHWVQFSVPIARQDTED